MFDAMEALHDQHWWLFYTAFTVLTMLFCLGVNRSVDNRYARRGYKRLAFRDNLSRSGSWAWTWACLYAIRDRYPSLNFLAFVGIFAVATLVGIALWTLLVASGSRLLSQARHRSPRPAGNGSSA